VLCSTTHLLTNDCPPTQQASRSSKYRSYAPVHTPASSSHPLNLSINQSINLIPLPLPQHIPILLQRTPHKLRLLPQIRRQEPVAVPNRHERSLERVLEGFSASGTGGVHVLDARELQQALDGGGCNEASAAGGGD
jgi:hypothetical protein